MTFAIPLKATLRLITKETVGNKKKIKDIIEKEVFLGELPLAHRAGYVCDQRRRARDCQSAPPFSRRDFRGEHTYQRPAAGFGPDHSVPRFLGRIHRRYPRYDLCPHRQEEEVSGDHAVAGPRLSADKDIIDLFYKKATIELKKRLRQEQAQTRLSTGYLMAEDIIDEETGEVIAEHGSGAHFSARQSAARQEPGGSRRLCIQTKGAG